MTDVYEAERLTWEPADIEWLAETAKSFKETEHPRGADGRFISLGDAVVLPDGTKGTATDFTGSGRVKIRTPKGETLVVDAKQIHQSKETTISGMRRAGLEDRQRLKIPPAWTDVLVSDAHDARILAVGRDAAGREQRRYSAAHNEAQADKKFARIRDLHHSLPELDDDLVDDAHSSDAAAAVMLIRRTGLRPGSTTDTKAAKQAYGATTLEARHVTVTPEGDVHLKFTGKDGVNLDLEFHDPVLADVLRPRVAAAPNPRARLFQTSDQQARDYLQARLPGYKLKDLRTYVGTAEAYRFVSTQPMATDEKSLTSLKRETAKRVSSILGNTPKIALDAYIDPTVFLSASTADFLAVTKSLLLSPIDVLDHAAAELYERSAYIPDTGQLSIDPFPDPENDDPS